MENCGACHFCPHIPTHNAQAEATKRMATERRNEQATERVLQKLALCCLACNKTYCRGIPLLNGKGSKSLPENKGCCFLWKNCYQCGVSSHDRQLCFDKTYLNNVACCECWVFKKVPGSKHHAKTDCEVKGRLRRLLSHHFVNTKVKGSFKDFLEGIYTSSTSFCEFMAVIDSTYNTKNNSI